MLHHLHLQCCSLELIPLHLFILSFIHMTNSYSRSRTPHVVPFTYHIGIDSAAPEHVALLLLRGRGDSSQLVCRGLVVLGRRVAAAVAGTQLWGVVGWILVRFCVRAAILLVVWPFLRFGVVTGDVVDGIEYRGVLFARDAFRRHQSTSAPATFGTAIGVVVSTAMGVEYLESELSFSLAFVVSFFQRHGSSR